MTHVMTTSPSDTKKLTILCRWHKIFLWVWCETFEHRSNPSCWRKGSGRCPPVTFFSRKRKKVVSQSVQAKIYLSQAQCRASAITSAKLGVSLDTTQRASREMTILAGMIRQNNCTVTKISLFTFNKKTLNVKIELK